MIVKTFALAVFALAASHAAQAAPRRPAPQPAPPIAPIAEHLQALAHFGRSAAKCGDWTDGEDRTLRRLYFAAARKLPPDGQAQATALYAAGEAEADHDFTARPMAECSALRAQVWMPRLRELAMGQRSFWKWP